MLRKASSYVAEKKNLNRKRSQRYKCLPLTTFDPGSTGSLISVSTVNTISIVMRKDDELSTIIPAPLVEERDPLNKDSQGEVTDSDDSAYPDNIAGPQTAFPESYGCLYKVKHEELSLDKLLVLAKQTLSTMRVTKEQADYLEERSRPHPKSKIWQKYHAGRITATLFKAAVCSELQNPSISLIKQICYPLSKITFMYETTTPETRWDPVHEKEAKAAYLSRQKLRHDNFIMTSSGFHISCEYPFLGGTPDGLVQCKCCGEGIMKIKYPSYIKDQIIDEGAETNEFFEVQSDSNLSLKTDHAYYYQMQAELLCTKRRYCDFVDLNKRGLLIQRIILDEKFLKVSLNKVKSFFLEGILPELLAKWYTKTASDKHQ